MLYPLCDYLYPADIDKQNNCKNVIDNSLPQIIETVVNNYGDVEKICTTLTLCPQIKVLAFSDPPPPYKFLRDMRMFQTRMVSS